MRRTMTARGVLVLLVACVCGSVQGHEAAATTTVKQPMLFPGLKSMNGAGSMGEMGEQFKANAEAVKASMAGRK